MTERPRVRLTVGLLGAGVAVSAVLMLVGFALRIIGRDDLADTLSLLGVLTLLITQPLGLLATSVELRRQQPMAAVLALLVVGILGAATLLALYSG